METRRLFACLACAWALAWAAVAAAQPAAEESPIGEWRVRVDDGKGERRLLVLDALATPGGGTRLQARYGWKGAPGKAVAASIEPDGAGGLQMRIRTPASSDLVARRTAPTEYEGQLRTARGKAHAVRVTLLSNDTPSAQDEGPVADSGEEPPPAAGGRVRHNRQGRIQVLYFGGNDCPPCRAWRALELPKLQQMPEWQELAFHHIPKTVQSPVPVAFMPPDLQPLGTQLLAASAGRGGSAQVAFVVDGRLADYWWGARDAAEIAAMVRAVRQGQPLPGHPCVRWSSGRRCVQPG